MNFDLNDDQKLLVGTVADFCKKESTVERMRKLRETELGYAKETWAKMGELGWLSVLFPEEMGGLGGSFTDAALIIEQLGTTLVPEPYIASVVLAGLAIRHSVSDEEGAELLASLIDGSEVFALAYTEAQSRHDVTNVTTRAEKSGAGYKLTGKKRWVLAGHGADKLVVSARTSGETRDREGVSLFLVDANASGVKRTRVDMMDGHKAAMIDFEGAEARLLGEAGKAAAVLEQVMDYGAAAVCAEGAGIMQTVLGMTRNYLCEREQFGTKIGTFQALQHRTVDMFVETQLAKSSAIMAMIKADDADPAERARAISAAKCQLALSGGFVVRQGTQLHGGIGVTDEHDIGLYFKRMHSLLTLFGDEEFHTQRYASSEAFTAHV
ncbi:MAG: acyl-CoA dehydrogenase family protein [Polyangiaceae bacterium]|nr:acyl-CoA dehydrogenase family protein [Myxococcales bacterium]MCB9588882.1 acyl-CoA dehydrogenase family protein [Polyangiaceae bacterium]MCB9605441.1 acyl-CoA dehydrogenase family protein [Polyangiaceae bacterium]